MAFAIRRNAGGQSSPANGTVIKEISRISEESMSMRLRISPLRINNPFRNNSAAEKIISCTGGAILKISIKNVHAAIRSMPPSSFTIMVFAFSNG